MATVFAIPAVLIMISLSVWQVQRLHWKEALIEERVSRTTAAPVVLAPAGADLARRIRRVAGAGVFDNDHEFYLAARRRTAMSAIDPDAVQVCGRRRGSDQSWLGCPRR